MNTNQLAIRLQKRLAITNEKALQIVKALSEEIAAALTEYDSVTLFGSVALRPVVIPARKSCAVPIPPECPICGEQGFVVRATKQHLQKAHGLSYDQFAEQYPIAIERVSCPQPPFPRILTTIRPDLFERMTSETNEVWKMLRLKERKYSSRRKQFASKATAKKNGGYNAATD